MYSLNQKLQTCRNDWLDGEIALVICGTLLRLLFHGITTIHRFRHTRHQLSFLCLILPGYELHTVEDCFGLTDNSEVFQLAEGNSVLTSFRDIRDTRHFTAAQTSGLDESPVQFEGKPRHQDMSHPLAELGVSEPLVMLGQEGKKKAVIAAAATAAARMNFHPALEGSRADLLSPSHLSICQPESASPLLNHPCIFYILDTPTLPLLCARPRRNPRPLHPFLPADERGCFLFFFPPLHLGRAGNGKKQKNETSKERGKGNFFPDCPTRNAVEKSKTKCEVSD